MGSLLSRAEANAFRRNARAEGKRVVFTNGCFDLLHAGHVSYLIFSRSLGDVLVVGLNDDDSVRRLKGPPRPYQPLDDRAAVLCELRSVDAVVAFSEDTPLELIRELEPDVLVKGADYDGREVVGRDVVESHGGAVVFAPYVEGRSTTELVRKVREGG